MANFKQKLKELNAKKIKNKNVAVIKIGELEGKKNLSKNALKQKSSNFLTTTQKHSPNANKGGRYMQKSAFITLYRRKQESEKDCFKRA